MNFDLKRILRDCDHNKECKLGQRLYDFDIVVNGAVVATWRRDEISLKEYELRDPNFDPIFERAPKEGDYNNPDYYLRAKCAKQDDLAAITEGLFVSGRIPTIEESRKRLEGWGRALLENRDVAAAGRVRQAQEQYATRLYDAIDALLSNQTTQGKLRRLLDEVDARAKEMTAYDRENETLNESAIAAIEAFTTTLSRRVA